MAITLTQLRAFVAVAETGSVRLAAERLFVASPSVSAAVAALADEVGARLLEREGRGVRLSAAGQALLPFARDALGLLEQGARTAREAAGAEAATLRVAAVTTAGEHVLPALLRGFTAARPDVRVSLEVGNRDSVLASLLAHRADVAIGGRAPEGQAVQATPFALNRYVVVAAAGHPLAARRRIPLARLARETWLVREAGSGTRGLVESYLGDHGIRPAVTTIGSNGAIREAAAAGLGLAVLPEAAVRDAVAGRSLVVLDVLPPPPVRQWHALLPAIGARVVARAFVGHLVSASTYSKRL